MLTSGMGMVRSNPDIDNAVKELLTADINFDRNECRSIHREPLVRYLHLKIRTGKHSTGEQPIEAVSRHISACGIEIITDQNVAEGAIAEIEIERLKKGPAIKFIAKCRWCRNFGEKRFIVGWKFESRKR